MSNNKVVEIQKLLKQFPVGGDFFTALSDINFELEKLFKIHALDFAITGTSPI